MMVAAASVRCWHFLKFYLALVLKYYHGCTLDIRIFGTNVEICLDIPFWLRSISSNSKTDYCKHGNRFLSFISVASKKLINVLRPPLKTVAQKNSAMLQHLKFFCC